MTTTLNDIDVQSRLSDRIGAAKFSMWFRNAAFEASADGLRVTARNRFAAGFIDDHFRPVLQELADEQIGPGATVTIDAASVDPSARRTAPATAPAPAVPALPNATHTARAHDGIVTRADDLRHDLDTFVVGPSNALAYNVARQMAEGGPDAAGALFVHGVCGVGKTHLLHGLCRAYAAAHPEARIAYTTAEQFIQLYVHAVRKNRLGDFRRRIRQYDLLAVDDVHFLANKTGTQTEFLHTIDAIDQSGAKLVLASDAHPRAIEALSEALVSRFLRGMVAKVETPDDDTRRRIIERLTERSGMTLRGPAIEQIVRHCRGSVRELEGALLRIKATAELMGHAGHAAGTPIGQSVIDRVFGTPDLARRTQPIRFDRILETVCGSTGVERSKVMSKSRHRRVVLARSSAIYLARQLTTLSYPELARELNRPNHSTIVTAAKRIEQQIADRKPVPAADADLGETMDRFIDELRRRVIEDAG